MDGSTNTKYVNYGNDGVMYSTSAQHGINSGLLITPLNGSPSIIRGILFATGNDRPDRDPITVTFEGTNSPALNASVWTLLYNGSSGLSSTWTRSAYGTQQTFTNVLAFRSYRLLVTSQRGLEDSTQYSEFEIFGYY